MQLKLPYCESHSKQKVWSTAFDRMCSREKIVIVFNSLRVLLIFPSHLLRIFNSFYPFFNAWIGVCSQDPFFVSLLHVSQMLLIFTDSDFHNPSALLCDFLENEQKLVVEGAGEGLERLTSKFVHLKAERKARYSDCSIVYVFL